jgi:hypothetical protein
MTLQILDDDDHRVPKVLFTSFLFFSFFLLSRKRAGANELFITFRSHMCLYMCVVVVVCVCV